MNKELQTYRHTRAQENKKAKESQVNCDIDESDIMSMVFDIFSRRKKFEYNLK